MYNLDMDNVQQVDKAQQTEKELSIAKSNLIQILKNVYSLKSHSLKFNNKSLQNPLIDKIETKVEEIKETPLEESNFSLHKLDDDLIFKGMEDEIKRSMEIKLKDRIYNKEVEILPIFISYTLKVYQRSYLIFRNGSISSNDFSTGNQLRVSSMVGDNEKGGGIGHSFSNSVPIEDYKALRRALWKETDSSLNYASEAYTEEVGAKRKRRKNFEKLSEEKKIVDIEKTIRIPKRATKRVINGLRELSSSVLSDEIYECSIILDIFDKVRFLFNSEDTKIKSHDTTIKITLEVDGMDEDGEVKRTEALFYENVDSIDLNEISNNINSLVKELLAMKKVESQDPGIYPTLLSPDIHGVFWHEAIGHFLESHRIDLEESRDFSGMIGKKICPDFISLFSDPTFPNGFGSYKYDEDGVEGQKVTLIEDGVLRNYLHSRRTAGKSGINSNGHSRADLALINDEDEDEDEGTAKPTPRMSNLIIESKKTKSLEELKKELIDICKKNDLEYGLFCKGRSGRVDVESEEEQFKLIPDAVYRIYTDGREELVKNVVIIGTPYTALRKIVDCGGDVEITKGYCGAESGWIQTEEIGPYALFNEIEFARTEKRNEAEPMLSPP